MAHNPAHLFPAIDLRHGACVRLVQGDPARETSYASDPLAAALEFAEAGAAWLHLVDLDAAFGDGDHEIAVQRILRETPLRIQLGGGVRTLEDIERWIDRGVGRVILGTMALESPDAVEEAVDRFGADAIVVGLDVRKGSVAVRGWTQDSGRDLLEVGRELANAGVRDFAFTDIERDGTSSGPNIQDAVKLAAATDCRVIVSGGVSSIRDIEAVGAAHRDDPRIAGVIVGTAIHDGRIQVATAIEALARGASPR